MTAETSQDNALLIDLSDVMEQHSNSNDEAKEFADNASKGMSAVPDGITDLLFMPGDLYSLASNEAPPKANPQNAENAMEEAKGKHRRFATTPEALLSESLSPTANKTKKKEGGTVERKPRNRESHNRLQSEFGWQMGLQAAKVKTPPVVPESETEKLEEGQGQVADGSVVNAGKVLKQEVKHEATPPMETKKLEPEIIPAEELKPPSVHKKDKSDTASTASSKFSKNLAKKEFGWQLALQENVGSIILKPTGHKDASLHDQQQIDSLPKTQDGDAKRPSQLSLPAKVHNLNPSNSSSSLIQPDATVDGPLTSPRKNAEKREFLLPDPQTLASDLLLKNHRTLEEQLNNPVRSEFGWQVGLAAKSLTFPLSKPAKWVDVPEDIEVSEFGTKGNAESLRTNWRTVAGAGEAGEPQFNAREPLGNGEFLCQLCFGNISVHEAQRLEGCDHRYCMTCLQRFILQTLVEQSFPMYCPACDMDEGGARGMVTENTLLACHMGPDDLERFYVLELRSRPVEVECPDCRVISEVPWISFNNRSWSSCLTCDYRWCKVCHKTMLRGADGAHLCLQADTTGPKKKRKGAWKQVRYCPGCGLRSSLPTGGKKSNEVACNTRGCKLHFCYVCAGVMADGTETMDTRSAVAAHNRASPNCAPSKHGCTIQ